MAKYGIKSLNYIACGDVRDFINMDLELDYEIYDYVHLLCAETGTSAYPDAESWRKGLVSANVSVDIGTEQGDGRWYLTDYIYRDENVPLARETQAEGIILNEQQTHFVESDASKRKYIRLYLSCCTNEMREKISKFNANRELFNQTYMLENTPNDKNNLSAGDILLRNAYDIKDVSIRRLGRHESRNELLTQQAMLYPNNGIYERTHHDVYAADMNEQPVGFCQSNVQNEFESDAIIMTQKSLSMPHGFTSGIRQQSGIKKSFDVSITQQESNSYTYKPFYTNYPVSAAFQPYRSYDGITRQYMIDLPLVDRFSQNDITADYGSGEAYYRRLMTGKNLYDSSYSMNMPTAATLSSTRTYCGIDSCAGRPYVKYWDDTNYNAVTSTSQYYTEYETTSANSYDNQSRTDMKPYQKIEYLYTNDYSSDTKHKSNVFSIEILSTGIGQMEDDQRAIAENLDKSASERADAEDKLCKLNILKRDITAAVRDIVKNVTPANTQLFDVYFTDN